MPLTFLTTSTTNEVQSQLFSLKLLTKSQTILHLQQFRNFHCTLASTKLISMTPRKTTRTAMRKSTHEVRIYIDDSNLWIQGQKASAQKHRYRVESDPTWRFDAGKLKSVLTQNCGLPADEEINAIVNLYGSTPPNVGSIWKAIKSCKVEVYTFERSSCTSREKEVDAEIIAASVSDAADLFYEAKSAIFIIVSGDKDLIRAVLRIANRGFQVHVWSWTNGMSGAYTQPKGECRDLMDKGFIKVHHLDEHAEEFSFYETDFNLDKSEIPPNSIVIRDPLPQAEVVDQAEVIDQAVKSLRIPHYRYRNQPRRGSRDDLIIIPACTLEHKIHTELFQDMTERLKQHGLKVMTYVAYNPKRTEGSKNGMIAQNPYKALDTDNSVESEDNNDDTGFTVVKTRQKQQKQHLKANERKIHSRCHWRMYCREGIYCKYGHTPDEKAAFKTYGKREAIKYKFCPDENCFRNKCSYAHTQEELFCPTCDKKGDHEMAKCPEKKLHSVQRYAS